MNPSYLILRALAKVLHISLDTLINPDISLDKEKIHAEVKVLHDKGLLRVLKESFFALLSPVIILGCIYSGE